MEKRSRCNAIILLGGSGERFGDDQPKQFHRLSGKRLYLYAVEAFAATGLFDQLILVCHPKYLLEVKEETAFLENICVVPGGNTRQESSEKGLEACPEDTEIVVIHDAVRPFITQEMIKANVQGAQEWGAVDTCMPSFDTIVQTGSAAIIDQIPERAHYWRGQTPQSFRYDWIKRAHKNAKERGLTNISDDCRLVLEAGYPVHIVMGSERNIKITTDLDLFLAEQLMRLNQVPLSVHENSSLRGKKYIVVGGTGGIGSALCQALNQEGAIVVPLSTTSQQYQMNITDLKQVEQAFARIHSEIGAVDGLINSAGALTVKPFKELTQNELRSLLETNLNGVVYCCKEVQLRNGGHIVNISSSSFTRGRKGYALYSSAKAGVVNFTQALAEELPQYHVNTIVPQRTQTMLRTRNFPGEEPHSLLSPNAVAETILQLLKQRNITGQIIEVRKK